MRVLHRYISALCSVDRMHRREVLVEGLAHSKLGSRGRRILLLMPLLLFRLAPTCPQRVEAEVPALAAHNGQAAAAEDKADLPRALLIGDSVSEYYSTPTRELLAGYANVHHIPGSGRDTAFGLKHLDEWLGSGKWDVIYFNWGLDDLALKPNGDRAVPLGEYQQNLRELVRRLKLTDAKLIWATTTPVLEHIEQAPVRKNSDVQAYNAAAQAVMDENNITVNNLYSYAPHRSKALQDPDDADFNRGCADQVASYILLAEAFAPVPDQPGLPRVLLIGDSISYYYTFPARVLLKGRANVHRIATNGDNTANALKRLDEWLGNEKWDVIYFNWGLHDLVLDENRKHEVALPQYQENLRELVRRLKLTNAKLIWASTTPLPPGSHRNYSNGSEIDYNAAALSVMNENHVQVDDLYAYSLPRLREFQRQDDVHFTTVGGKALGEEVARGIQLALGPK